MVQYIAIEGPPGVGKTSLARLLGGHFNARLVLEIAEDNPFLPLFYEDPERYGFQTQAFFLLSRFRQQSEFRQMDLFHEVVVSNYLFARDGVYAHVSLSDAELSLYERLSESLQGEVPRPDLVIYLQNSAEALLRQIHRHGPAYERLMDEAYLARLVEAYNHYFFHFVETPLLVVNVSQVDLVNQPEDLSTLLKEISSPPAGTRYCRLTHVEA